MGAVLKISLAYKASHHVARINHPVHSSPHFHTWHTTLMLVGFTDAHAAQQWMHETAPHFGDHGDLGVEDVAKWWLQRAQDRWNGSSEGVVVDGVEVLRDDGIGALIEGIAKDPL